jgi:aspartyl/asparaginyl beta-hydroxylase (cupin superfamily)
MASLAERIDDAVCSVYGEAGTARVRRSVRSISDGEELDRVLDGSHELMRQQANSFIADLTPTPWHDPAKHKWARKLEQKWAVVRDELAAALADGAALESRGQNVWGGLDEAIVEYGTGWKTLPLCDRTVWDPVNAALFPRTCALLDQCKVPLVEAFFAKMDARSEIKPHSDMCNFVLTCHLGVDVPEGECDLTVGDATREWRNGGVLLFDTSILHAAENRADRERYILMMRVYHPELSGTERSALQLVFDCLDEPELLDDPVALSEYDKRRRAIEAASREAWQPAGGKKGRR